MGFKKDRSTLIKELVSSTDEIFNNIGCENILHLHNVKLVFAGTPESNNATVGIQYYIDDSEHFHLISDADDFEFAQNLYETFIESYSIGSQNNLTDMYVTDKFGNVTGKVKLVA